MMIKKWLSLILCAAIFSVSLMATVPAYAATTTLKFESGTNQSGAGYDWNGTTNTLTLTNFNYVTSAIDAVEIVPTCTLVLNGANVITSTSTGATDEASVGLILDGGGTITGSGNLTVTGAKGDVGAIGFWAGGTVTMNGTGTVKGVTVDVSTSGISIGVYIEGDVTVNSGKFIGQAGKNNKDSDSFNIGILAGSITQNNGELIGRGNTAASTGISYGIISATAPLTFNSGTVTASGIGSAFDSAPQITPTEYKFKINTASTTEPATWKAAPYTYSETQKFVKITTDLLEGKG